MSWKEVSFLGEANGDNNAEGGEFEDIEDDENLSFDRLSWIYICWLKFFMLSMIIFENWWI